VSPAIMWKSPPASTKSFAVLVHDPDAPTGGAGTADGKRLPVGSRQVNTEFGAPGWGGPCPPIPLPRSRASP
jgi:phosphatidylethanolamine-binding protein (PEBP) family uncharacterized protein